jgi:hypothetical protein
MLRSVTWLMAVLLVASCQYRRDKRDEGEPGASAGTDTGAQAQPAGSAPPASGASAAGNAPDPFDAEIAKNLAGVPDPAIVPGDPTETLASLDNAAFRDRVVGFVREVAAGGASVTCSLPISLATPLKVTVWMFQGGATVGRGQSAAASLCVALKDATRRAIAAAGADRERLAQVRFGVELPERDYALVEHEGKGVELSHGLVPVRTFAKDMLRRRIDEGKAYLLRVIDSGSGSGSGSGPGPGLGGVHKYYHAPSDTFEDRLHTIYTASTIFTLIKLHAHDKDERLRKPIDQASKFLLSMQSREPDQRSHGGFHYSFDLQQQKPERKFVVGTTSKSIFTLIELHALTRDRKYLEAARLAADWLLTMQQPDGSVHSYLLQKPDGSWVVSRKESMLYTGQVLSALSRTYRATGDKKYLGAASQTAEYLASKIGSQGCYLGDDYRKPNPISSSWAILSLLDFVKASDAPELEALVFRCARELLGRQIGDAGDVYRYGRWRGSLSSSGNGWLAEVMAEVYLHCEKTGKSGCDKYEEAIVKVIRLLMQHTYAPENAFVVKNPEMAIGGVFWNVRDRYVRTDSVCHAMNAYVYMIDHLDDGVLVEVPEPPLAERLRLDGAGSRAGGGADRDEDSEGGDSEEAAPAADESGEEAAE